MRAFMNSFVLMLSILLVPQAHSAPEIGKPAPAFTAVDTNGKSRSLAEFAGKFVVLEWLNYECPFVKKHYGSGNMQALQKKYAERGVVWLSVISSAPGKQGHYPPAKVNQMNAERKGAAAAILLDPKGEMGRAYEAKTTPHLFVINPKGALIYAGAIDDRPTADAEDIPGAKNYVTSALDEALAGRPVTQASSAAYGCAVKY